ncbi:zf-HC2 domain-containing protein [Stigmatella erecta]|uniref:Putative zinc-finger n=1 Tax=Stigmatella erecta TaxID=83460 RepID=A0A1I0K0M4_9BACT|nr:zf-HC2 domain-containing protein [Stigmatella erecta]SEU16022.1 Putative zinc-finger [Stigmatella erecta]
MSEALSRYQSRRQQLTGASLSVGSTLEIAGELLRRSEALGTEGVKPALLALSPSQLETWLSGLKPGDLRSTLLRAAEEAIEVALGDGEEAELWRASAMEGLGARDRVASALRALREWEGLHGELQGEAARLKAHFLQAIGNIDTALLPRARWFIPLNPYRREERGLLDEAERNRAWWFSARAHCDDLVASWVAPAAARSPHLESCSECREDLEEAATVDSPPSRHLSEEDLWRFDMGTLSGSERARIDAHAGQCEECAQALLALDAGDAAIEEALGQEAGASSARTSRAALPPRPGARHPEQREVLEERREFRVLLVRDRQRVRLLVSPLEDRTLTAAVFLSPGKPSLKPIPGPEGLSFELGESTGGLRSAHLSVKAGTVTLERDFSF